MRRYGVSCGMMRRKLWRKRDPYPTMPVPKRLENATPEELTQLRQAAAEAELRRQEEGKQAMKPVDDHVQLKIADWLLKDERKAENWTVKEQAHQIDLNVSDYYKAMKRQLSPRSKKQQRFDEYIAKLRKYRDETDPPIL